MRVLQSCLTELASDLSESLTFLFHGIISGIFSIAVKYRLKFAGSCTSSERPFSWTFRDICNLRNTSQSLPVEALVCPVRTARHPLPPRAAKIRYLGDRRMFVPILLLIGRLRFNSLLNMLFNENRLCWQKKSVLTTAECIFSTEKKRILRLKTAF